MHNNAVKISILDESKHFFKLYLKPSILLTLLKLKIGGGFLLWALITFTHLTTGDKVQQPHAAERGAESLSYPQLSPPWEQRTRASTPCQDYPKTHKKTDGSVSLTAASPQHRYTITTLKHVWRHVLGLLRVCRVGFGMNPLSPLSCFGSHCGAILELTTQNLNWKTCNVRSRHNELSVHRTKLELVQSERRTRWTECGCQVLDTTLLHRRSPICPRCLLIET